MSVQTPDKPINVLVVDDHPVLSAGLSSLLRREQSVKVIGSAHSGEEAFSLLDQFVVDLILLDLRMPKISGIDFLQGIRKFHHPPAVVILSSFKYDEEVYRAVKAGARGYLSKDASREEIVAAITMVGGGRQYFPPDIARYIAECDSSCDLSSREVEILEMVAKRLTNREIGKMLQISQFTVRNHIGQICSKLQVSDRTEATAVAMKHGIIETSN